MALYLGSGKKANVNMVNVVGGGSYVLPIATPETLGGVKPTLKTEEMTQSVGVDETGALWTTPSADVGDIETALDSIIAIQNELIGGDAE